MGQGRTGMAQEAPRSGQTQETNYHGRHWAGSPEAWDLVGHMYTPSHDLRKKFHDVGSAMDDPPGHLSSHCTFIPQPLLGTTRPLALYITVSFLFSSLVCVGVFNPISQGNKHRLIEFIYSSPLFIQSFNKCFPRACYVPGTVRSLL